jgi:tRNA A-37 threonylcarbamoyl transferase component Bud32
MPLPTKSITTDLFKPGYKLGRYRLEEELGRGGVGSVYRAVDESTGRVVALKTQEREDELVTTLFEREYHTLASLRHPCVIEVFDFAVSEDGRRYYTMELLEGQDLNTLSPLPWKTACEHLRDVATSLALLHARRFLHRDVSPGNVRIDSKGRAKLIDFGALTPFGVSNEIVGTPPCMAPEVLRSAELDQRTDLFSLGVVAYVALTGRKPKAIRRVSEIEKAWRTQPAPPSTYVSEIPAALDQLVLSLLSVDRLGRPSSAAEVIDRLSAIAEMDEEPLGNIAESHLLSTALIGREREKAQLSQHLIRAMRGQGNLVILEGSSGMGRTRLANELLLDARVFGMATLRVEALAHPGPYGVLRSLAKTLTESAPAEARETLAAHLSVLGQSFPFLIERSGLSEPPRPEQLPHDPAERRARIQTALVEWIVAVTERKPLLIVIDDIHVVDADSAGALVVLAHAAQRARLMVVATHLVNAQTSVAIQQIIRIGARIKLRSLEKEGVEQMVASTFGDVPHRARLAQWLYSVGHGIPSQSLELLRDLVDRKTIRYAGGAWVLPSEFSERNLPQSTEGMLSERIGQLSSNALRLARLLALHRGTTSLSLCSKLLPEISRSQLYTALDELTARNLLVGSGDGYRLGQEALRSILIDSLDADTVRELHLVLGGTLVALHAETLEDPSANTFKKASTTDLGIALQAGWHFLHGGESERGRDLLRNAGIELTRRGDGLVEAVPALEAALAAYRKEGRSRYECGYLMTPLTLAGAYTDFRLSYLYGDELLDILCDVTGITMARRWSRWLGARLSLFVSLAIHFLYYRFSPGRYSARSYREAFLGVIGISAAVIGTCNSLLDKRRAQAVLERIKPLHFFSRQRAVGLVHDFMIAMTDATFGRYGPALRKGRQVIERLRDPKGVPGLPEEARVQIEIGCHILNGSLETNRTDGSVHATIEAIDNYNTSISRQTAAGLRAAYHANRGERARFAHYREEVDVLAAQAGSTWRQDVLIARNHWWTHALSEDVLGLKRTVRLLEELSTDAESLSESRDAAAAAYLAERGMYREALERCRSRFEAYIHEPLGLTMRYVGILARVLRAAGQVQRAREVCETALARLRAEETEFSCTVIGVQLELALSIADLGDRDSACEMLDRMLDEQNSHDNPLIRGLTHKTRAYVALLQRDQSLFDQHLCSMQQWFKRTENPALIAQCQKLAEAGRKAGLLKDISAYSIRPSPTNNPDIVAIKTTFGACRGPAERLQTAIDLILDKTHAERGYLYLLEPDGLTFAAPNVGSEPPEELLLELKKRLEVLTDDDMETVFTEDAQPNDRDIEIQVDDDIEQNRPSSCSGYRSLFLLIPKRDDIIVVGAIALVQGEEPLRSIDADFLIEVARGIYDAGDVQTVYYGAPPPT